ncbi:MAG: hypothetical protein HYX69_09310 [Planctomycetia bacterium]|nr:hypothetical protein [Planctomycetia bacterium]
MSRLPSSGWLACATTIVALVGPRVAMADDKAPLNQRTSSTKDASAVKSLDDELLKDLGPDPLGGDAAAPAGAARKPAGARSDKATSDGDALDRELLKGLGDGEDLGPPGEQDPLTRLNNKMREVESLMARSRSDDSTQRLQTEIIRDLDDLIKEARKQCQGGNSSSSSGKGQKQATRRRDSSQPGRQSQANRPGDNAARQSRAGTREDATAKPDLSDIRELLKGVWGRLPERDREQMLQSYEEQFLPKYEQMIADYFRSIAEQQKKR